MDYLTIGVGVLLFLFGVYTAIARVVWPSHFAKLEPMKARFGAQTGLALHFFAYTMVPWALAVTTILAGVDGVSIGDLLSRGRN